MRICMSSPVELLWNVFLHHDLIACILFPYETSQTKKSFICFPIDDDQRRDHRKREKLARDC